MLIAGLSHFRFCQFLKHPITQSRRASAAAGKSQHQRSIIGVCLGRDVFETVAGARIHGFQPRIDGIVRTAISEQPGKDERRKGLDWQ